MRNELGSIGYINAPFMHGIMRRIGDVLDHHREMDQSIWIWLTDGLMPNDLKGFLFNVYYLIDDTDTVLIKAESGNMFTGEKSESGDYMVFDKKLYIPDISDDRRFVDPQDHYYVK